MPNFALRGFYEVRIAPVLLSMVSGPRRSPIASPVRASPMYEMWTTARCRILDARKRGCEPDAEIGGGGDG